MEYAEYAEDTTVVGHVSRQKIEGFEARAGSWLNDHIPALSGTHITSLRTSAAGGLSGETYIITLDHGGAKKKPVTIVLKKDVGDKQTNRQTSFSNLVATQTALGNIDGLRVPRVMGYEASPDVLGAQFLVMGFVEGEIPADAPSYAASGWVHGASADQRRKMWQSGMDFLVQLHKLDWQQLQLEPLRFKTSGSDDLERCLNYNIELFRQESEGESTPLCEQAIAWLVANRPAMDRSCICWGDARIGNIIWRDFAAVAFIDWEMSSMGCPGIDLGWWSFFHRWPTFGQGNAALAGMCVGQELADLYEARGGNCIENFRYYEILATLRGLSVWLRMYKFMRADGKLPPMDPLGDSIHMIRVLCNLMD